MKTLILLFILLPASAGAMTNYYNSYGTYEGQSYQQGNSRFYYNYRGDYMGQAVDTSPSPNPAPVYRPAPRIELTPIPGSYEGITPTEMIGDPE